MSLLKRIESILFVSLTLCCLPLSTLLLFLNCLCILLVPVKTLPFHDRHKIPRGGSRTLLLSGINTPLGLRLARAFREAGHRVVGADYEPGDIPSLARFSTALARFYPLRREFEDRQTVAYIRDLLYIIDEEDVDVWITCTSNADPNIEAQARHVIEMATRCHCFALRMDDAPYFLTRSAFLAHVKSIGLPTPEKYRVTSRDEIHKVLNKAQGVRRYLLHSPDEAGGPVASTRTILPRRTLSQTYNTVSHVHIAKTALWRLDQDTDGLQKFSTFSVIARGRVTAFVASSSTDLGSHHALDPESALSQSMLRFVQIFASKHGINFSTHIGITFCVEEQVMETRVVKTILPVEISGHAHACVALFHGSEGSCQLSQAYLACLPPDIEKRNGQTAPALTITQEAQDKKVVVPNSSSPGVYCFGQALLGLGCKPLATFISRRDSLTDCLGKWVLLLRYLLLWQEDTYSFQDPWPFWWSYQIYIPLRLVMAAISVENDAGR